LLHYFVPGTLGCDYFSAYRRYHREFGVTLQFSLAHLIRDVKFLTTLPDVREQAYGTRLREALRALFGVIHRREQLTAEQFQSQLEAAWAEVVPRSTCPPSGARIRLALYGDQKLRRIRWDSARACLFLHYSNRSNIRFGRSGRCGRLNDLHVELAAI
jgi:hypothetical protein